MSGSEYRKEAFVIIMKTDIQEPRWNVEYGDRGRRDGGAVETASHLSLLYILEQLVEMERFQRQNSNPKLFGDMSGMAFLLFSRYRFLQYEAEAFTSLQCSTSS